MSGGSKTESESWATSYEVDESQFILVRKGNMTIGRESHALVSLNAKYLYAIGSRIYK